MKRKEFENAADLRLICRRKTLWKRSFSKRWRNRVISLPEFSSNLKSKIADDCCFLKFLWICRVRTPFSNFPDVVWNGPTIRVNYEKSSFLVSLVPEPARFPSKMTERQAQSPAQAQDWLCACVLVKRYLLLAKSIAVSILRCKIPRCYCVKNTFKSVSTSTTRIIKTTNTKCRYYLIIRWYKTKFISFRIDRKQPYIQHYNQWKTIVL